jgi:hypothetical protein
MALFGSARDISMFRYVNRELMGNVISQECVYYKVNITETLVNMYGETSGGRYFNEPVIFNCLVEVGDQTAPTTNEIVGFDWPINFRFLRDDLVDANIVPEIGDIIMWQEAYWEIDNENVVQFVLGKDPDYSYNDDQGYNPLNPGLGNFGYNVSVICKAHYVPQDRINLTKTRL